MNDEIFEMRKMSTGFIVASDLVVILYQSCVI